MTTARLGGTSVKRPGFWTTEREIEFLRGVSLNLKRKYLKTMHKRDRWGDIDPLEVYFWLRKEVNP